MLDQEDSKGQHCQRNRWATRHVLAQHPRLATSSATSPTCIIYFFVSYPALFRLDYSRSSLSFTYHSRELAHQGLIESRRQDGCGTVRLPNVLYSRDEAQARLCRLIVCVSGVYAMFLVRRPILPLYSCVLTFPVAMGRSSRTPYVRFVTSTDLVLMDTLALALVTSIHSALSLYSLML